MSQHGEDPGVDEGVRVTDKRRIDPVTGQVRAHPADPADTVVRETGGAVSAGPTNPLARETTGDVSPGAAEEPAADERVAELTADLQRVSAEYANYRKRVDRDREAIRDIAAGTVVSELLPVLDDIGRAREHGEYEGALRSMGDALEAVVVRLGLEAFGEVGDEFDPTVHEAMTHSADEGHPVPQVAMVYQVGYRFRGRVLRPARVGVAE